LLLGLTEQEISILATNDVDPEEAVPAMDGESNLNRPSEYLRGRCPLCFGGEKCHDPTEM